jgi:UDP-MurNAc hydroxylase
LQITHYNNSFLSVASQGERIVCDPWIGKANSGGWHSFPEFPIDTLALHLSDAKWVYVSHLHDDHYHPETLKLCRLLDREFIIKRFKSPTLRDRLKRLGVKRVHEVDCFTVQRFGPFELSIFPQMSSNTSGLSDDVNYDLDTSIAIKADGAVFFNQVDNPFSKEDVSRVWDYIVQSLGEIDVACLKIGAASEYPQLFLDIDQAAEKSRIVQKSLAHLGVCLRQLKPKYFFPAGGTYIIPGWMSVYNDKIAQPDIAEITEFIKSEDLPSRPIALEGGNFLALSSTHSDAQVGVGLAPIGLVRQNAIELHRNDSYLYEDIQAPSWSITAAMLNVASNNWKSKASKDHLQIRQSIRFEVYSRLMLDDDRPDMSLCLGSYQLNTSAGSDAGELVIHIDQRALIGCLTRRLIWNGVLGSLCLYERRPNRFYPTDVFSLNYLVLTNEQAHSFGELG